MNIVSVVPRIRERLWRERKEEYGYAFLLMEHHCFELCEDRIQGIMSRTAPARWFLNKFRYESDRLKRVLCERHDRIMLGNVDCAFPQTLVISRQLSQLEEMPDPHGEVSEAAVDRLSDALIRIRSYMYAVIPPYGSYGARPQFSYALMTTDPA
jgi:hypothetical protein